jgi:cytochrome c553
VGTPPPATQTCVACHGADGATTVAPDYPKLAGLPSDYIVHALKDYKSGKRKNPIMAGIISGVDEKDFEAIAEFFSRQTALCTTDQIQSKGKCAKTDTN